MDMAEMKKLAYRKGEIILLLLAVLTIGEFLIGYYASIWWAPLLAIALIKAFLIVRDYMHIGRVFAASEEEVH
jgi:hypothetical protein